MPAASDAVNRLADTASAELVRKQAAVDADQQVRDAQLGEWGRGNSVKSFGYGRSFAPAPAYTQGPQAYPIEEDAFGGR